MSSAKDVDPKPARLFDVRTIERNIKKGLVTRKDYEKHLKSLEDATEKAAPPEDAEDEDALEEDESDAEGSSESPLGGETLGPP